MAEILGHQFYEFSSYGVTYEQFLECFDYSSLATACKGADYVFHLAASVGGIQYIKKENVEGCTPSLLMNTNILEAARRNDIQRLLFASSACVYREKSLALNSFVEEDPYPA